MGRQQQQQRVVIRLLCTQAALLLAAFGYLGTFLCCDSQDQLSCLFWRSVELLQQMRFCSFVCRCRRDAARATLLAWMAHAGASEMRRAAQISECTDQTSAHRPDAMGILA